MKKVIITSLSLLLCAQGFAQTTAGVKRNTVANTANLQGKERVKTFIVNPNNQLAKTTGTYSDTLNYYNNYDSLLFANSVAYSYGTNADSGYLFGMNAFGDNGFAEYFSVNYPNDTSVQVIGVMTDWAGTVKPTSTNSITFQGWTVDTTVTNIGGNYYVTGLPGTSFATSQAVPLTQLTVNNPAVKTITYFNTPISNIKTSSFLGYTVNYSPTALNGDTIGLRSTPNGTGFGIGAYYVPAGTSDTVLYSQNAVFNGGSWIDAFLYLNTSVNLSIVPIFRFYSTVGVQAVTKKNLTFFGNYPNPAVSSTNISFSLAQPADVTLTIMDMNGRVLNTIAQKALSTGAHIIPVATGNLAAGNYVYAMRTSDGASLASQFTIVK